MAGDGLMRIKRSGYGLIYCRRLRWIYGRTPSVRTHFDHKTNPTLFEKRKCVQVCRQGVRTHVGLVSCERVKRIFLDKNYFLSRRIQVAHWYPGIARLLVLFQLGLAALELVFRGFTHGSVSTFNGLRRLWIICKI